jgi:septum formation protein
VGANTSSIILASSSPRRRELLAMLGIAFEVIPSHVDEEEIDGETPREHVARLSQAKAREVGRTFKDRWILGADTIVFIDGEVLGKPRTKAEAATMLRKLSGREHRVMTGFFIYHPGRNRSEGTVVESRVAIKELTDNEIKGYIKTGEPFDKAGAYAVQGVGMFMIEKVFGSHTNVIGLPVCEVVSALRRLDAIRFFV